LRVALREEPEAVLVRLELPDEQGVELVQALQAALPGTAIAALVGAEDGAAAARAREAGLTLTDYFAAPLDVGAIESWIEEAVGGG
jgi:ActR/RegA family two-component response regulator